MNITVLSPFWQWLTTHTGRWLKGAAYVNDIHPTGSSDTLYHYVSVFTILLVAITGSVIWSLADRKRRSIERQQYWALVIFRYNLALILFSYGLSKVIKSQFPDITLLMLDTAFGESSPMGLAWKFFGYSKGYNLFMGLAEVIPAILLLFRRTSLAGALLSIGVMGNVAMLNLCYDIPVKLFSIHLVLVSIFIAAPELWRLYLFFFTNKAVPPTRQYIPIYTSRTGKSIYLSVKILSLLTIIVLESRTISTLISLSFEMNQHPPLFGIYTVEHSTVPTDAPTHYRHLQQIYLDNGNEANLRLRFFGIVPSRYVVDTVKHTLTIRTTPGSMEFNYRQLPENRN
ncbi:MAG: hypothetical protein JO154_02770 [Chitinophaga sp.]|nr:hypothetical protein [Chitinophaga sp.]